MLHLISLHEVVFVRCLFITITSKLVANLTSGIELTSCENQKTELGIDKSSEAKYMEHTFVLMRSVPQR